MADYALEGQKWGGTAFGSAGGTVAWALDGSVPSAFRPVVASAFSAWAAVANISFAEAASTATANITLKLGAIDGVNNVLGITTYSYSGSLFRSAAVEFDSGEGWGGSGANVVSTGGAKLFLVALHEIGHAIGLDHYNASSAIMNSLLSPSLTGLTRSDIDGVQAIYGASAAVASASAAFGQTVHDASSAGGAVFALYDALMDRAPDPLGFEGHAKAVEKGLSVSALAGRFLASTEGSARFAGLSDTDFIETLYRTALNRSSDAGGLAHWQDALAHGQSRAEVAATFALSSEHLGILKNAFDSGIFVPNQDAADVARLYHGILGRAPDSAGLRNWTSEAAAGRSLGDIAAGFVSSDEAKAKFAGLSDAAFVDSLFQGALGRHADSGGLAHYTDQISHGTSRATVALDIAESTEAHLHLASVIETGWVLA